jgi:hypothetical protein
MRKAATSLALACVAIVGLACAPTGPNPSTLNRWVGVSTRESVRQELGAPTQTLPRADGGAEWTYRYSSRAVVHDATRPANQSCWEYVLVFDDEGILRTWERQRCSELGDPLERARERATGERDRGP